MLHEAIERYRSISDEERAAIREQDEAEKARECVERLRASQRRRCGLADVMWDHTLESFPVEDPTQQAAVCAARALAQKFPTHTPKGLYLWGQPGRGKSGIMQGLVQAVLSKPRIYNVLYLPAIDIDRLRQEIDVEQAIIHADMVVIDDLEKGLDEPGTRFPSQSDKILRRAIHRADRHGRPLICATSNVPMAGLEKLWPAFGSRLAGLMYELEVKGPDMRRGRAYEEKMPYYAD